MTQVRRQQKIVGLFFYNNPSSFSCKDDFSLLPNTAPNKGHTVRNWFARFLSLVGMSLIKVSLDRNNLPIICQNFNVAGQEFYQGVFLQFYSYFWMGIFLINFVVMLFSERSFYFLSEEFSCIWCVYLLDTVFFPDFVRL